jgi:uncharacterized membrane protein
VETGRLEAFSDGVFAVAITLLAFNLAVGGPGPHHPTLAAQLAGHWPAFAAYAVSFASIGIIWVNHHTLFRTFSEIDRTLMFVNLLLLFFVVSIPFTTATLAAYLRAGNGSAALAAALYQGAFEGMAIGFSLLFWSAIRRGHLQIALTPQQARHAVIRFGIGNLGYIAGIGLAFVSAPASLALSGLVAVYYVLEQTPMREQLSPDHRGPATATADSATNLGRTVTATALAPRRDGGAERGDGDRSIQPDTSRTPPDASAGAPGAVVSGGCHDRGGEPDGAPSP